MEKLLAIDPGETVGYAWFSLDELGEEVLDVEADQCHCGEFIDKLEDWLIKEDYFHCLIENYIIRQDTMAANIGKELKTAKLLGVIEYLLDKYEIAYYYQPAGQGKAFFDRERLEGMGLWVVGKNHARDAIRHGLWFVTFGDGINV